MSAEVEPSTMDDWRIANPSRGGADPRSATNDPLAGKRAPYGPEHSEPRPTRLPADE